MRYTADPMGLIRLLRQWIVMAFTPPTDNAICAHCGRTYDQHEIAAGGLGAAYRACPNALTDFKQMR